MFRSSVRFKGDHPSNQDTLTGPKGGQIRRSPLIRDSDWSKGGLRVTKSTVIYQDSGCGRQSSFFMLLIHSVSL